MAIIVEQGPGTRVDGSNKVPGDHKGGVPRARGGGGCKQQEAGA